MRISHLSLGLVFGLFLSSQLVQPNLSLADSCNDQLLSFVQQKKFQEAVWSYHEQGARSKALEIEKKIVDILKNAQGKSVKLIEKGITKPALIELSDGVSGVFKPNVPPTFKPEVAAYRIDLLLDLNIVPITVERRYGVHNGSMQYFVKGPYLARPADLASGGFSARWAAQNYPIFLFDFLIGNLDRHEDNILRIPGKVVAIDHAFAFEENSKIVHNLEKIYIPLLRKWDDGTDAIYKKIESISDETWVAELSPYLSRPQINSLIRRKNFLLLYARDSENSSSFDHLVQ